MNDVTFEKLGDGIEIAISSSHRFGTDAFLLADFAAPRHKDDVCDLCGGNGIVSLLLYKNFKPKYIRSVEIQREAHELLKRSLNCSGICNIDPILCDLREYKSDRELDVITCNPPYKLNGTGAKNETSAVAIARHEILCTVDDVCACAARNLRFGGRLCLCNRPERLTDIFSAMRKNGIEPKRIRFVSKNSQTAPWLVLVEGKKGGNSFLQVDANLFTHDEFGNYTDEMKRIYCIDN